MKIVLVTPNFRSGLGLVGSDHYVNPSIGLGLISSILLSKGHDVIIKDPIIEGLSIEQLVDHIIKYKADILGISAVTMNYNNAVQLAENVKIRNNNIPIIVGGPHFYSNIDTIMRDNEFFDFACVGEGDYVIDKLIDANYASEKLSEIEGLVYRKDSIIFKNPMGICTNIDELPLPAYQIYPKPLKWYKPALYTYKRLPNMMMVTSRGCPSKCIYCQGSIYNKRVRMHSPEYVINHIKFVVSNYGIRDIFFIDDIFTLNRKRLYEICDLMLKENLKITWTCFIKANSSVDEEMLKLMKKAGCWMIQPGIESGSPDVLKILKKGSSFTQVERVCRLADKLGIQIKPCFMLGNPGETKATLKKTFDIALSLPINHISVSFFSPLPGTPVWDNVHRYGDFNPNDTDNVYFSTPIPCFIPHAMKSEDLENKREELYYKFYFRMSNMLRNIKYLKDIHELRRLIKGTVILFKLILGIITHRLRSLQR